MSALSAFSVPGMIDAGEIWSAGALVSLSRVLLKRC
jgi:hypothetical protein